MGVGGQNLDKIGTLINEYHNGPSGSGRAIVS